MGLFRKTTVKNQEIHNAELRVDKFRAVRAIYNDGEHQEVEIKLRSTDGEMVTLRLRASDTAQFINELANAYEAINPPTWRGTRSAQWDGMS